MLLVIGIIFIITFIPKSASEDNLDLKMLHVVFRHADRSPTFFTSNDPYKDLSVYWPMGKGEITNNGKNHAFSLGQFLRNKYSDFLGTYNSKEVYARSTDVGRVIVTADLVLAGLYPPEKSQEWNSNLKVIPVPVHTVPKPIDEFSPNSECPRADEAVVVGPVFDFLAKELLAKHSDLLEELSNCSGDPYTNTEFATRILKEIVQTFIAEVSENLTLPKCIRNIFPEPLISLDNYIYEKIYQQDIIRRLRAGTHIRDFVRHFNQLIEKNNQTRNPAKKVYVYSTHDDIIAPILAALQLPSGHPAFLATIVVEFLQETGTEDYFVQVLYKNSTEDSLNIIPLPGCDDVTPCPVDVFYKSVQSVIPVNWHRECGNTNVHEFNSDPTSDWLIALGVTSVALFIFSVVLGILLYKSTNKRKDYNSI